MSDLAERLDELRRQNVSGSELTDKQAMALFLEGLSEGKTPAEAVQETGRTRTWFRARRNPDASNYNREFAEAYERIMAPGGEFKSALVDDVFTALVKSAKEGNVRAQEKILAAYSEDFGFLRPQVAQGPVNVEQLQVFFGELPLEKLLELKQARDQARMKELPVIDQ